MGRPRLSVDFAIVLRLRDDQNLGWSRMAEVYRKLTGEYVSRDTMKLDNSGDGLRLLQEHLGHASFNTTAKYRKIAGDEHRRWYDGLWNRETQ